MSRTLQQHAACQRKESLTVRYLCVWDVLKLFLVRSLNLGTAAPQSRTLLPCADEVKQQRRVRFRRPARARLLRETNIRGRRACIITNTGRPIANVLTHRRDFDNPRDTATEMYPATLQMTRTRPRHTSERQLARYLQYLQQNYCTF